MSITDFHPNRYAVIDEKNPREIIMLRGKGCAWRRCRFCDYHLDSSPDQRANHQLNAREIAKVTGIHHRLEVINSGSFVDLPPETLTLIAKHCQSKHIQDVHFECHWQHRDAIEPLRAYFAKMGIRLQIKIGVETFDALFRESYLDKGIDATAEEIAAYFDEVCLLQGLAGQTVGSMLADIATGLQYFRRVCVNIMQENAKPIKPSPDVIAQFIRHILPIYETDPRVDILLENTAFGVGGVVTHA